MLAYFRELEQINFVSKETKNQIDYTQNNFNLEELPKNKHFFEEDNCGKEILNIPICELNRH